MRGSSGDPGEVRVEFGLGQFFGLLRIVDPGTTLPVLAALIQTGVPHRPANPGNLIRVRQLIRCESDQKTPTRQHASTLSPGTDSHPSGAHHRPHGWVTPRPKRLIVNPRACSSPASSGYATTTPRHGMPPGAARQR